MDTLGSLEDHKDFGALHSPVLEG